MLLKRINVWIRFSISMLVRVFSMCLVLLLSSVLLMMMVVMVFSFRFWVCRL